MIDRLRSALETSTEDEFLNKIRRLTLSVREGSANPTVLLIGVNATSPLTILDGNHRMAAAMLSPLPFSQLRFICGFSPKMTACCWYYTNINTLLRYLRNLLRHISYDPESDIDRFQQEDLVPDPLRAPKSDTLTGT